MSTKKRTGFGPHPKTQKPRPVYPGEKSFSAGPRSSYFPDRSTCQSPGDVRAQKADRFWSAPSGRKTGSVAVL